MKVLTADAVCVGADLTAWLHVGGGEGLARALANPAAIIPTISDAGLRGMGGAGFPTAGKWQASAVAAGARKWIVCNGNEDEPGTFKDRFLLHHTPHQVIEGALIAALAVGATQIALYVNRRETPAVAAMRGALAQWQAHPLLDALQRALGERPVLSVVESSGLYIGGEETAVIAAVEGGFPFPRRKPPFPAEAGVHGCPTVLNNVETFAHVPHILRHGADWYRALGRSAPGTKLYSLSGDVLKPGLYELPMGSTLRELVFEHGGGMLRGRAFKAVFTGGPSNTLLTGDHLDVHLDFDNLRACGSRLGTGAIIVVSQGTSIVRKTAEYVSFFAAESCGQCPPCKVGTYQIARVLDRIDTGLGSPADLVALENLCTLLPGSGRCKLVDGAVTVLASSLATFRAEYEAQVRR